MRRKPRRVAPPEPDYGDGVADERERIERIIEKRIWHHAKLDPGEGAPTMRNLRNAYEREAAAILVLVRGEHREDVPTSFPTTTPQQAPTQSDDMTRPERLP